MLTVDVCGTKPRVAPPVCANSGTMPMDFVRRSLYGDRDEGGPWTDTMQVCEKGHTITDMLISAPDQAKARCPKDGSKTICECPECGKPIAGRKHYPRSVSLTGPMKAPDYCEECGKPFPWTQTDIVSVSTGKRSDSVKSLQRQFEAEPVLRRIADRLHIVIEQLTRRHQDRPTLNVTDEYDLQDLLHGLLRLFFDDVRPEQYTLSYAGKSARIDFVLPDEHTVVEVKHTRETLTEKQLGDELLLDIARYRTHPLCRRLFCLVYDPGRFIHNPRGLERDLMNYGNDALSVVVTICPP